MPDWMGMLMIRASNYFFWKSTTLAPRKRTRTLEWVLVPKGVKQEQEGWRIKTIFSFLGLGKSHGILHKTLQKI